MGTNKGVSIIICCYNSSRLLPATLRQLSLQQVSSNILWEVIIINNNSKDDTTNTAAAEWGKYQLSGVGFTITNQPKPGLNYAREMGIKIARYEYVIFCDDDNWLCNTYVSTAFEIMESNPTIGVLGGRGIAVSNITIPDWFEKVQSHYAVGRQAEFAGDISNRKFVWGAGMVLRKKVLLAIFNSGIKSYLSDRKGDALTSGGDSEISMWFLFWGYRLWYNDNLIYKHFVPAERLSTDYYSKLKIGLESSVGVMDNYNFILQYKNSKHRFKYPFKNAIYTFLQIVYYKFIRRDKKYTEFLINIFLLHSYNFISSNSLLATMARDILPKVGYRFPANKI